MSIPCWCKENQEQPHPDTYFNIIDHDLVALEESRNQENCNGRDDSRCLKVDIWTKQNGEYPEHPQQSDVDFVRYLTKELGWQVREISAADQKQYGVNFLTFRSRLPRIA